MNCLIFTIAMLSAPDGTSQAGDTIPAAPCKQTKVVTDTIKGSIIRDFISSSIRDNYFINNKGILVLKRYQNTEGDSVWSLTPMIDNSYQDNPPTKFSTFGGDIILVYEANQQGNVEQNSTPMPFNACLEDVIGDRVYLRPSRKDRWINPVQFGNRTIKQGTQRASTGNGGQLIITFKKDGSYETFRPG